MQQKLYNVYSAGEKDSLIELERMNIDGIDYMLLLQKEFPNIVCVGYFENGKLYLEADSHKGEKLLKMFIKDDEDFKQKLEPFVIKDKK